MSNAAFCFLSMPGRKRQRPTLNVQRSILIRLFNTPNHHAKIIQAHPQFMKIWQLLFDPRGKNLARAIRIVNDRISSNQNRRGFRNRTVPFSSNLEFAGIFLFSSNVPIRRYAGHLEIRCTSLAVGGAICLDRIVSARKEA